ncbi:MAG: hypothetical protein NVS3B19_15480 [Ginsengibacter sp.]
MTQSGMGCPDWPRCFGRWIPPTNESQLPLNYKKIYAFKYVDTSFNVYHTWVEYINRLLGMLLGILLLIQFVWSLRFWNKKRVVTFLCGTNLILTGFQGYLGSKVVEANLEVVKITIHMLVALIISAVALSVVNIVSSAVHKVYSLKLKRIVVITIVLLLIQIILGTQVRQQIDDISKSMMFEHRDSWIQKLNAVFKIHRLFSFIVAAASVYVYYEYQRLKELTFSTRMIFISVSATFLLGAIMSIFNMPAIAQPAHLLFSSVLLMALFYNAINTKATDNLIENDNVSLKN